MRRARPARAGAFTLLEVLAAVALLGILYTTLAGVATTWLRAEGEARRRLEASLEADRRLAEIEVAIAAGNAPEPGESTIDLDPFRITTRVAPLELPVALFASEGQSREAPGPTLFSQQGTHLVAPLRQIDVFVDWEEGDDPRRVERTTLAFDREAAAPVLAAIPRPTDGESTARAPDLQSSPRPQDAQSTPRPRNARSSRRPRGAQ